MVVTFSLDEVLGLIAAVEAGIDDRNDYLVYGNPRSDYGDEWPDIAGGQSEKWKGAASAIRKLGAHSVSVRCTAIADSLFKSAKEYHENDSD